MNNLTHNNSAKKALTSPISLFDVLIRAALFAALWWALNEGDNAAWTLGAPVVALATLLSVAILPRLGWRFSLPGLLRFALYFLRESLLSSVDVASRVFRPQMPLQPGLLRYPLRLPAGSSRVLLAGVTSLLPGTFCANLEGDELVIHALDTAMPIYDSLRRIEARIAAIYQHELTEAL